MTTACVVSCSCAPCLVHKVAHGNAQQYGSYAVDEANCPQILTVTPRRGHRSTQPTKCEERTPQPNQGSRARNIQSSCACVQQQFAYCMHASMCKCVRDLMPSSLLQGLTSHADGHARANLPVDVEEWPQSILHIRHGKIKPQ